LSWAVGVFIAFFLLSLLFIVWLWQSEIRRLEENLGIVGERKQSVSVVGSSGDIQTRKE
jgi:hypothetical protein